MPQSLAQSYLHIVFSTKNRQPVFHDPALRTELHHYLGGACRGMACPSLVVGAMEDHVHVLCRLARTRTTSDLVRDMKRESSKWLKTKGPQFAGFHWQDGFGAFSISPGHVEKLREYIAKQEEHHRAESFQDEFRRLLRLYDIEFDEQYVWD